MLRDGRPSLRLTTPKGPMGNQIRISSTLHLYQIQFSANKAGIGDVVLGMPNGIYFQSSKLEAVEMVTVFEKTCAHYINIYIYYIYICIDSNHLGK